ncbi:hypothetical protein [Duganella sp. Root1480D1]|uniref:hypothetical protein n=1 Tax=Duganella sp. Root1480D1 TaxID=1736471 RepID=UPI00070C07F2|nr:hypothetical protein [Duganella sp. Root1480D1]KQZ43195.1 hypothetical protein ASD58_23320 [Duganella sp. Root1480D1]
MKVAFKVLLFCLVPGLAVSIAALFGMPGARDGNVHIAGDYYFTHSGGDQNSIIEEHAGASRFVVHMKVEEFIVQGDGILVTRRPVLRAESANNRWEYRLPDTCEYYRIDVAERKVQGPFTLTDVRNRAEWAFHEQRRARGDFGATRCKLDAIWSPSSRV